MKKLWILALTIGIAVSGCDGPASSASPGASRAPGEQRTILNDFDVTDATIPAEEIHRGGPPRDGIPSIDNPVFLSPEAVDFLSPGDTVLSFEHNGDIRAYPFRILVWHEVVNDTVGGKRAAITYCPLCGTAMVFSREIAGETLTFGVSGLLYQSDVLLFDRETESLWSQIGMKAVNGLHRGRELEWLPSRQMTWSAWKEAHPEGKVLSTDTGHARDYTREPYAGYEQIPGTMFPVSRHRDDLGLKTWVIGVLLEGEAAAYPVARFESDDWIHDTLGNHEIRVRYDAEAESAEVERLPGNEELPHVFAYWFAWQAFYPETTVWANDAESRGRM